LAWLRLGSIAKSRSSRMSRSLGWNPLKNLRLATSAPAGDPDLYLWVIQMKNSIPGSVQVLGTGYPYPQVDYLQVAGTCNRSGSLQVPTGTHGFTTHGSITDHQVLVPKLVPTGTHGLQPMDL
jgi:hypothetical protein